MRHGSSLLTLLVAAVLVTGCAPQNTVADEPTASATTTSTPVSTPSATPSPTSTGDSEDPADPSTWVIRDTGIGPIALGAPFSEALAAMPAGTTNDVDNCAWTAWWTAPDGAYQVYIARDSESGEAGPVLAVGTSIAGMSGSSGGPVTAEGLGAGVTADDVLATYPDAVEVADAIVPETLHFAVGRIFFTQREGETVSTVTVTDLAQPPYEFCG